MTERKIDASLRGPIRGVPPTLEWIAVDKLLVDKAYQRATDGAHSRRIIVGMVKGWDWALCQPLVVTRRDDGSLYILDGQHRHSGASARGDIPHLPCVVVPSPGAKGEAEAFVALNTKRQKLSQSDIFNGMLASGDADAVATQAMLEETGWKVRRHANTHAFNPGDLNCAPMLVKMRKAHGEAVVRNALVALREAYPDSVVTVSATLLKALIFLYRDDRLRGEDPDLFIEAIGQIEEPRDWEDYGREQKRLSPVFSRVESIGEAMLAAYRDHANAAPMVEAAE